VELLISFLVWAGPIGILGGFITFMVMKKGWAWNQVITAGIFALLVASAVPNLPQATNDGMSGFVDAFVQAK
jgi:hypothetical protein